MKKVLSLILAAALVIGLVPAAFAAEANTAVASANNFIFMNAVHGISDYALKSFYKGPQEILSSDTSISDAWGFVNQHYSSTYGTTGEYMWWRFSCEVAPSYPSKTASVALELDPDVSGTLTPSLTFITEKSATSFDIYLFEKPDNIANWYADPAGDGTFSNTGAAPYRALAHNISPDKRIGHFDAYGNGEIKTIYFPQVTIDASKNYYLVFAANGANANWSPDTTETDRSFGTLKAKSFSLSNLKSETERPTLTYNIGEEEIKEDLFSSITNSSAAGTTVDNTELALVSWRDVYYIVSNKKVLKKDSTVSGVTKSGASLDLTKTDPYEMHGRSSNDNAPALCQNGFSAQFILKKYDANGVLTTNVFTGAVGSIPRYIFRINVPEAGTYNLSIINDFLLTDAAIQNAFRANGKANADFTRGAWMQVHLAKANFELTQNANGLINNSTNQIGSIVSDENCVGWYNSMAINQKSSLGIVNLPEAGEYFVSFQMSEESLEKNTDVYHRAYTNTDKTAVTSYTDFQMFLISGIELAPVENAELDATNKVYDSIVNVDPGNAVEKTPASTTSNVQILSSVNKRVLDTKDVSVGTEITYTAPEETGYTFLYWAQGIGDYKKIVSYDAKLSLKAEKGPMRLTAVYSDNSATKTDVIFYNANGDEISRRQYNEGDAIILKDLPSMAGFGKASGWTLDKDSKTYTSEDGIKASGKLMRFVAEYADEPSEKFAITVVGGTADNATPAYGDTVKVTATPRNGVKLFNYWMRDGEIVSFDLSYSFKAYKDTTVTAVYNDYLPVADTIRKIIIGTRPVGKETAAVAEFIGISDAVEKGILFGTNLDDATHKVSMKTDGDTFSVIDDVDGEAIGYAILANGNVIYSK